MPRITLLSKFKDPNLGEIKAVYRLNNSIGTCRNCVFTMECIGTEASCNRIYHKYLNIKPTVLIENVFFISNEISHKMSLYKELYLKSLYNEC